VLPCSGYNINTYFAGGVSNGEDGIATLWYNRDGLQGLKSWFYFGDAVVCLGAGITSAVNRPVNTTVNQSRLNGKVWLKQQAVRTAGSRAAAYSKVAWVLHDGWGYYFPGRATVQCQADEQEGNWQRVVGRMPATPERAGLFTLWLNHGNRPAQAGYAYYVLPAATQENIGRRAALLRTGRNHRDCQVAEDATHAGVVFAQSGSAQTVLAGQVTASDACVVLLTQQPGGLQVAVSDPLHHTPEIQLTFAGHHASTAYPAQYDAATNTTQCRIPMPQGLQSGSSVLFLLEPVK
jgi:chondroitin AC lyase